MTVLVKFRTSLAVSVNTVEVLSHWTHDPATARCPTAELPGSWPLLCPRGEKIIEIY